MAQLEWEKAVVSLLKAPVPFSPFATLDKVKGWGRGHYNRWAVGRMVWFWLSWEKLGQVMREIEEVSYLCFVYSCNTQFPVYTKLLGYEK